MIWLKVGRALRTREVTDTSKLEAEGVPRLRHNSRATENAITRSVAIAACVHRHEYCGRPT